MKLLKINYFVILIFIILFIFIKAEEEIPEVPEEVKQRVKDTVEQMVKTIVQIQINNLPHQDRPINLYTEINITQTI
jgi:hypothetical protein